MSIPQCTRKYFEHIFFRFISAGHGSVQLVVSDEGSSRWCRGRNGVSHAIPSNPFDKKCEHHGHGDDEDDIIICRYGEDYMRIPLTPSNKNEHDDDDDEDDDDDIKIKP